MRELGRKNLCYSLLLAAVLMVLLTGYFIWMLPSLYVSYTEEQNLKAVRTQHQSFMETGTYDHIRVKNPSACVSVRIPFEKACVELTSKRIAVIITAENADTIELMEQIQSLAKKMTPGAWSRMDDQELKKHSLNWQIEEQIRQIQDRLNTIWEKQIRLPFALEVIDLTAEKELYYNESFRIYPLSDQGMIVETTVFDDNNQYTNYLAVEQAADAIVFTVLPVITPQMEEIRPVVMQSIPMLCAVILMLVLIFSQLYSNGIVHPVYKKLEDVNQHLMEENKRQEMFLGASSHQLKTPITAALLLIDGMIGQIGKYKDYEKYLPKVKEQLLSMRRMAEEILSLNQTCSKLKQEPVHLYELIQAQTASYQVAAAARQLKISVEGTKEICIRTDADLLAKIIDNLLANAVAYTQQGGCIRLMLSEQSVTIQNQGMIPADILPHIFEPFVSGEHRSGSHGLGLYIAAYYARMMGADLRIYNREKRVEAILMFAGKRNS